MTTTAKKAKLKLLAVVIATFTLLTATACGKDTKANTNSVDSVDSGSVSADITPADDSSLPDEESIPEDQISSEESKPESASPAAVTTQTKPAEGFSADAVKKGEISVNGAILKPGITINELNAIIDEAPKLCTHYDTEEDKAAFDKMMAEIRSQGSFTQPHYKFYAGEGAKAQYNAMMLYGHQNYEEKDLPHGECTVRGMEFNLIDGTENVDIILPNGWYLGGTLNDADTADMLGTKLTSKSGDTTARYTYTHSEGGFAVSTMVATDEGGKIISIVLTYAKG